MQAWIREALEKSERLDRRSDVWRADGYDAPEYRLNPPLGPEELARLERGFVITVPEQYRQFLLEAGNGGGGLSDFGYRPTVDYRWDSIGMFWVDPGVLARPFLWTEPILYGSAASLNPAVWVKS